MKKRLIFLALIVLMLSLDFIYAEIKTEDYSVAYGNRKLIDLNIKSPVVIKLHETSKVSFRYPGTIKNTMLINNISKEGINVTMLGDAYENGLKVFIEAEDYYRVFANEDKVPDVIIEPKIYRFSDDPKERTVTVLLRTVQIIQGNSPTNYPIEVSGKKVTGKTVQITSNQNSSKEITLYSSIVIGAILLGVLYFYFEKKSKKIKDQKLGSEIKN